jgi:predicted lipoprotein with Yx(FWY)xxD motif
MSSIVRRAFAGSLAAVFAVALWGCGSAGQEHVTAAETSTAVADTVTGPATRTATRRRPLAPNVRVVRVAVTRYGSALTDRRGFALYLFTRDSSSPSGSTCYGACATAWPPYIVARRPSAVGPRARRSLLGTVRRRDGRLQVTYAGHPLYHYIGDKQPGQVLCQAVTEFGGTWYLVAPGGHAIH